MQICSCSVGDELRHGVEWANVAVGVKEEVIEVVSWNLVLDQGRDELNRAFIELRLACFD